MGIIRTTLSFGIIAASFNLFAEPGGETDGAVRLYQIGKAGNYCLSITRDESGCISGDNAQGNPINVLDFIRGRKVVFENLSDAPHDMKFSGTNAEEIPPQAPQGAIVGKQMANVDNNVAKITCSFHGDQLGVGYKVPEAKPIDQQGLPGHNDRSKAPGDAASDGARGSTSALAQGARPIVRTGIADVSDKVLQKARPEDVARLIANRPELIGKLKEVRPLLAEELSSDENLRKIIAKAPGSVGTPVAKTNENGFGGVDSTRQAKNGRPIVSKGDLPLEGGAAAAGAPIIGRAGLPAGSVTTDFGTVSTYNLADRDRALENGDRVGRLLASGKGSTGKAKGTAAGTSLNMRTLASLEEGSQERWFLGMSKWSWAAASASFFFLFVIFRKKKEKAKGSSSAS